MKFKRQSHTEEGINLTPLIDVVFLLLIFFMVSTTFTNETHLQIDLPEAEGESSEQIQTIEVLISAKGDYSVNGRRLINNNPETLSRALQHERKEAESALIITADANTPHQAVVTAMDVAGKSGFARLSITTRKPDNP